jgi:hypothetical protein
MINTGLNFLPIGKVGGNALKVAKRIGLLLRLAPRYNAGTFSTTQRKLQHMFGRHARDFGFTGNWNGQTRTSFENAITKHVQNIQPIQGTYRGKQRILHYYDNVTGNNVMTTYSGELVGGWKLSNDQIIYLHSSGNIQ